jgi:regulatory protein
VTRATSAKSPPSLRATALRLLARREFGRAELEQRLLARGAAPDEVARTLDDLERLGYLSDARYAQAVVAQKAGRYGKRAIAHELKQKRIAPAAATEALAALAGDDELAQATALWTRRFGTPPRNDRQKAQQLRFLYSRGYSTGVAWKVLRAAGVKEDES